MRDQPGRQFQAADWGWQPFQANSRPPCVLFISKPVVLLPFVNLLSLVLLGGTKNIFQVKRETTGTEVNELLKAASEDGPLKGIMGYETRPLVSTDYTNDERSGIVDARSTMVVDGTCVKVCARVCACVCVWDFLRWYRPRC